ncbi:MAG TPA: DUF1272 domain-containing protein [Candidatus Bathyarchaeia archaeon]|nr:DUF1272 domain-containing protein [Candidatus Bathyarchaeia archaeon]
MEYRDHCERCNRALSPTDEAYFCFYECTWCPTCMKDLKGVCPNCYGELLRRPRPPRKYAD